MVYVLSNYGTFLEFFHQKPNAGMILLEETVISPRNDPQILDFGALGNHAS